MTINDPAERIVAEALTGAGVRFVHEMQDKTQSLDFFLPDYGIFIEVKQFSTPRTSKQIEGREDVILIQGKHAARQFLSMLNSRKEAA